jgi:hypothetical protein
MQIYKTGSFPEQSGKSTGVHKLEDDLKNLTKSLRKPATPCEKKLNAVRLFVVYKFLVRIINK